VISSINVPRLSSAFRLLPIPLALVTALAHGETSQTPDAATRTLIPGAALEPVFVTANPLRDNELFAPATALYGDALALRGADSLGATLNGLPGVSTTTYGPMVGRPIIRGMDGDRIRLLQNGVASFDASSLSYDHAVPQDPLSIERVEIVRGPAALLYGGNAIGGVVNTIDNRIPREPIKGVTGTVDANYGGANDARAGAAQVEGGNGAERGVGPQGNVWSLCNRRCGVCEAPLGGGGLLQEHGGVEKDNCWRLHVDLEWDRVERVDV